MGFHNSKSNCSQFLKSKIDVFLIIIVYVDDILITWTNCYMVDALIVDLNLKFSLKDLGLLHYFLGIKMAYSNNFIHLSKQKHIRDLLESTCLHDTKEVNTPMVLVKQFSTFSCCLLEDAIEYRKGHYNI